MGRETKPRKPRRVSNGARFGRPFDAEKRAEFLRLIREGNSIAAAAPAVRVSRETVTDWLRSGRSGCPQHPEHKKFAEDYAEAEALGTIAARAVADRHGKEDPRTALALLRSRGVEGFGPTLEQQNAIHAANVRKAQAEAELAEVRLEAERKALGQVGTEVRIFIERDLG